MCIFLLVQSGYSSKNFILSDFLKKSEDKEVVIWTDQEYISDYKLEEKIISLPTYTYNGKLNFIQKIKNRAEIFLNVKLFKNQDYKFYLLGIYTLRRSIKDTVKKVLIDSLGKLFSTKKGIQYLDIPYYKIIRKTRYYKECKKQLLNNKPTIVFCTHQRASSGVAPVLAARDLGIKTVCFIHSWDNVPKGVLLIKADEYFVWSTYMKNELLAHYSFINPKSIKVTGTPQFMVHLKKEYQLDRSVFLSKFNLNSSKKYILFTGNDKTTSPNDPVYLSHLCKAIIVLNVKYEDKYRIIFRPNPIDKNEGFDKVLKKYSGIVQELKPEWFGTDVFLWNKGGPNIKDISLQINTLLHSELIINMGSTMALDAAILGKPSCYINYDVKSDYNWSVKRIYRFIHFNMIKKMNPIFWINKEEAFVVVLEEALKNSNNTLKAREQWIQTITQTPIEETTNRMWKFLKEGYEV